jgi:hypothetical protein
MSGKLVVLAGLWLRQQLPYGLLDLGKLLNEGMRSPFGRESYSLVTMLFVGNAPAS